MTGSGLNHPPNRPVAEFVYGHNLNRFPKYFHKECFEKAGELKWKTQFMMDAFFKDIRCTYCGVKLQCTCKPWRISEPETGECKHAD